MLFVVLAHDLCSYAYHSVKAPLRSTLRHPMGIRPQDLVPPLENICPDVRNTSIDPCNLATHYVGAELDNMPLQ